MYSIIVCLHISSAFCWVGARRAPSPRFWSKETQSEPRGKGSAHSMTQEAASFFFGFRCRYRPPTMRFSLSLFTFAAFAGTAVSAFSSQLRPGGGFASVANIDEKASRQIYPFTEWAEMSGVQQADGFEITSNDGEDYFAMTRANIPAGSPVLYVPNQMLISSFGAAQEFGQGLQMAEQKLAEAGIGYQVPLFRVFVKILAEYEKGDESPFFKWLDALPRQFYNGASMTYACFDALLPYVAWLSMTERTNSVNFQKAIQNVFFLSEDTTSDKDLLKWAYCVAVSRSIEFNGERVIAPMADYFNHGTETEVEINFDEGGNCMVYASKDIPAGSPLRMSLGDPTNPSPLFATYGFLDESSPATFCKMMDKQDEMQALGYDFSNLLFYKDTGDISPEVYDVTLYSLLGNADPNLQQAFYQAVVSGDEATKNQYHQQYFQYTLDELKNHVNKTLRELDELSNKARSYDPRTHPRVPVILKHNEFVKDTFLRVKANLEQMG